MLFSWTSLMALLLRKRINVSRPELAFIGALVALLIPDTSALLSYAPRSVRAAVEETTNTAVLAEDGTR